MTSPPPELINVTHYHQRAGAHPNARCVEAGTRWVELVTGGRGWVWHHESHTEVTPGTLLWHYPGDHTIGRSDFENPYRCLAVRFRTHEQGERQVPRLSYWRDHQEIRRFAREAVALFVEERFDRQALAHYLISRLYFQARLDDWNRRNRGLGAPLRRVLALIDEQYARPLRMEELARAAAWSVPHLHEVFRDNLQQTPHQYLLERRVRAAQERLISTAQPIKSVALDCGFSSASAFCSAFRSRTGESPAAYRRSRE